MAVERGISIAIVPTAHEDYLRLECTGTYLQGSALEACERAITLASEAGRPAVLVDIRTVGGREPTMAERYELAVRVSDAQAALKPRVRFALLGHEPMIHPERFGEIIATTRGALARAFTDEKLALDWLLGRSAEP